MGKIILRVSGQDDFSKNVPDDWVGRPSIFLPKHEEITFFSIGELPTAPTENLEFTFGGYEEMGNNTLPIYKLKEK